MHHVLTGTLASIARFTPTREGAFRAFLRRSVDNRVRDYLRRAARRPALDHLDDYAGGPLVAGGPSPLDKLLEAEAWARSGRG